MGKMIPTICGKPRLFVSEEGCGDCDKLEARVKLLEECCENVRAVLPEKLEASDIHAGNNIVIQRNENGVTINSTGGGSADLSNYYNKVEVDELISGISTGVMKIVETLPAVGEEHIIYLVPKPSPSTGYNEYMWIADEQSYELIGDTDIDLSNYYNKTEADALLNTKVDKVAGKGLSTNDYTTIEKNKLDGIEEGAEVNVQSDWNVTDTTSDAFIKNKPGNATQSTAGLMSAADKTKLDGIEAGAEANVQADWNQTDSTKDDFIKNKPGKASTTTDGLMSKEDKTKLDSIDWTKEGILRLLGLEEVLLAITGKEGADERKIILAKDAPAPATYRTALYPDGRLIINESSYDQAANKAAHGGEATNVYAAFDPDTNPYAFSADGDQPWFSQIDNILSVSFGSAVAPTSTFRWFSAMHNVVTIDLTGLDTSNTTTFERMFTQCNKLKNVNTELLDTSNVTSMMMTFYRCDVIETLDLSTWDTSKVTNSNQMFRLSGLLKTIYASAAFVTTSITNSNNMFAECPSLVGGAGTVFDSTQVKATYARIDNPPTEPGYFTARP